MLFALRNSMLIVKKRCPHLRTKSLTTLQRTSDEKLDRNRPIILSSLIMSVDDIIMKKTGKIVYGLVRVSSSAHREIKKIDKKTGNIF